MRIIRLHKKNICWFCASVTICLIVLFVIYAHYSVQNMKCSDALSKDTLEEMCFEFKAERITGNLCHLICSEAVYTFKKCLSTKYGKEVYLMEETGDGEKFILKSKHAFLRDFDPVGYKDDKSGQTVYPDEEYFEKMLIDSVNFNFHIQLQQIGREVPELFWQGSVDQFRPNPRLRLAFVDSLWALMQQDEYVLSMYAQSFDSQYIPQVLGSCGHFYMIEYVYPGSLLDPGFAEITQLKNVVWGDQAKVAMGILDLVKSFDSDFHETLHLCDVKGGNFGLSKGGKKVKAIDTDMAFFDTRLQMHYHFTNCTRHSDCDFFDCKGWCDISKHACTKVRINNNLQAVCEKIFVSSMDNAFHGLLKQPPSQIQDKLDSLLEMCVNPPRDPTMEALPGCDKKLCATDSEVRWKARMEVLDNLQTLLKASL